MAFFSSSNQFVAVWFCRKSLSASLRFVGSAAPAVIVLSGAKTTPIHSQQRWRLSPFSTRLCFFFVHKNQKGQTNQQRTSNVFCCWPSGCFSSRVVDDVKERNLLPGNWLLLTNKHTPTYSYKEKRGELSWFVIWWWRLCPAIWPRYTSFVPSHNSKGRSSWSLMMIDALSSGWSQNCKIKDNNMEIILQCSLEHSFIVKARSTPYSVVAVGVCVCV